IIQDTPLSCSTDANVEKQRRKQLASEGVDLILSLFIAIGQKRLFSRIIMTKNLNGQIVVHTVLGRSSRL
ncbi:MAG: hypothetical protein WAM14_23695, partial [Candidatus Nitrosopolaris sp.]